MNGKNIDLVLEGGGVKGIAIAGAYTVLEKAGYSFHRIAGTSAGAIVAALMAAGYTASELKAVIDTVEYPRFADPGFIDRFGIAGKSLSVLFEKGIYEGQYLENLVADLLAKKGIRTFGDLRLAGEGPNVRDAYKLVVIVADVTRAKMIRLPWDYREYGLDPDRQSIAAAVRASAAIPFFYEPSRLGSSYLVDGSLVSNFPVALFESQPHGHDPHRPTVGIKLSAKEDMKRLRQEERTDSTFAYAFSLLDTMINAQDQIHVNAPCTVRRTMFVDTEDVAFMDFSITPEKQSILYQNGIASAEKFLQKWDYQDFLKKCSYK